MKVLILNGNPGDADTAFDNYLARLSSLLVSRNHEVDVPLLRHMKIAACMGCFGCWVKTPGECVINDDSADICRRFINSDLVIFASPLIMGFTSATLKRAHDRFIPLLLPYIMLENDEMHHLPRYDKYPHIAVLIGKGDGHDQEDVEIAGDIYRRDAINFKSTCHFVKVTDDPIEEVANEIDRI